MCICNNSHQESESLNIRNVIFMSNFERFLYFLTHRFMRDHPDFFGVKLIFAPIRLVNESQMDDLLKIARQLKETLPNFIAGFDLVGQEDKGQPLIKFANKLYEFGKDIPLFFHAGETNWYGMSTDENLIDAVLLNTKRIGHG